MVITFFLLAFALPLFSAGACWLFASEKYAGHIATGFLAAMLLATGGLAWHGSTTLSYHLPWWQIGSLRVEFNFLLPPFVKAMIVVVALVSLAVHVFSIQYIAKSRKRYFATLGLFTGSMVGLLVSNHLIVLFCFWELMGLCSYLLIGFWRQKNTAAAAATKAFLINKVGDAALLAAILMLYATYGTFHINALVNEPHLADHALWLGALVFLAVAAKSAQWPLHAWLPDAMEGPTPVSALIHAATMVAAGVILYARVYPLLLPEVNLVICFLGLISACLGGYQALVAYDLKKILAYSTLSQLGVMIAAIALGAADAGLIHLLAHAFFKAGLFLMAGLIIHHYQHLQPGTDAQDLRLMGGLRKSRALFVVCIVLIGALAGFPLTAGFLSKENILAVFVAYADGSAALLPWVFLAVLLAATFLTVLYSWRLVAGIFLDEGTHEQTSFPITQRIAVGALAACSSWFLISWNPFHADGWLAHWLRSEVYPTPWTVAAGSVAWILAAAGVARAALRNKQYRFAKPVFSIDEIYRAGIVRPVQAAALAVQHLDQRVIDRLLHGVTLLNVFIAHLLGWFDQHIVDGTVNQTARLLAAAGNAIRKPARGEVQRYLAWAALGMIIFLFWMLN